MTRAASLDLGVTGNCIISALIDREASVVWSCLPRLDGDPVFHAVVDEGTASGRGYWAIQLAGFERSEQEYLGNTAVLVTRLFSSNGSAVEITEARFRLASVPAVHAWLAASFEALEKGVKP